MRGLSQFLLLVVLAGCGGSASQQVNIPGSTGGGGTPPPNGTSLREFIVIPNLSNNTVTVKQVNLLDGTSTPRSTVSSGANGAFVVKCNPATNVFYVLNSTSNLITEFRIDTNGNVSSIGNIAAPGNGLLMTIHPSGRLVFVAGATANQVFTYAVANDGTLTKIAQTAVNFLNGTPGLDADLSGAGAFLHIPTVGGVQTCAIQNDGSLTLASFNNFGTNIGATDYVLDVDVHPNQTSLQASVQRVGNDAIASAGLSNGALNGGTVTTVPYEVGLGDFSGAGRYYLGENAAPKVHGFDTVATTGARIELASSPSTAAGVSAFYTQVDFTSAYVFSTQSTASNLLVTRTLGPTGEFTGSTSDVQDMAAPQLFDFFLFQVNN